MGSGLLLLLEQNAKRAPLNSGDNSSLNKGKLLTFLEYQFQRCKQNMTLSPNKIGEMFKSFCVLFSYGILAAVLTG